MAFERCPGLSDLARYLAKDPSVISRNLQRLAESQPVIQKLKGRWALTPLGINVIDRTRAFVGDLNAWMPQTPETLKKVLTPLTERAALVVINAQKGLLQPTANQRNNLEAETNIAILLRHWREAMRPVIHVRHSSSLPTSSFFKDSPGFSFISTCMPVAGELIFEKTQSSAFSGTVLAQALAEHEIDTLFLTGFTANECIDATARHASEYGFATHVVGDASASFDVTGPDGTLHPAERIHRLVLANMHAFFAKVVLTKDLI